MAELATIARPYAEALFQAERSDLSAAQEWLDALAAVVAEPIVQNSPLLPPVGVWAVSQSQCGGSSSQTRY